MARVKDMTRGKPLKLIIAFALPMLLGNAFQQLYSLVDTAVVGKVLGMEALAAVGAAGWLDWMVLGCLIGLTTGFSIVVSQRFGAGDIPGLRRAIAMACGLAVASAVILLALSLSLGPKALVWMNTPPEALPLSVAYVTVIFAGLPVSMAYNLFSAILRALGNSRTPLVAMIISSIVNVVLDLVFVAGLHWGVRGAAGATVIGQGCAALFCLMSLAKIDFIRPHRADWRPHMPTIRELLRLSLPVAGQNTVVSIGGLVLQAIANGFGVAFVAGFSAAAKIQGLLEMTGISLGSAMATYAGQNLGARAHGRIREGVRQALLVTIAMAVIWGTVGVLFGRQLTLLFISADAAAVDDVIASSMLYLRTSCATLTFLFALFILRSTLQGMGDAVFPILSAFGQVAMRIGMGLLLPRFLGGWGVCIADASAWVSAAIMLYFAYRARINRLDPEGRCALI